MISNIWWWISFSSIIYCFFKLLFCVILKTEGWLHYQHFTNFVHKIYLKNTGLGWTITLGYSKTSCRDRQCRMTVVGLQQLNVFSDNYTGRHASRELALITIKIIITIKQFNNSNTHTNGNGLGEITHSKKTVSFRHLCVSVLSIQSCLAILQPATTMKKKFVCMFPKTKKKKKVDINDKGSFSAGKK